jgi:hypothetical protein
MAGHGSVVFTGTESRINANHGQSRPGPAWHGSAGPGAAWHGKGQSLYGTEGESTWIESRRGGAGRARARLGLARHGVSGVSCFTGRRAKTTQVLSQLVPASPGETGWGGARQGMGQSLLETKNESSWIESWRVSARLVPS